MRKSGIGVGRFGAVLLLLFWLPASALAEKISIIMPAYNSAAYIGDAIRSVRVQTHVDWELLIVDDGSTDETASVANEYAARDSRIKLVRLEHNSGVGTARNAALPYISGRYLAFLDSDDMWLSDKLAHQLEFMQKRDIAFSFTAYRTLGQDGSSLGSVIRSQPHVLKYKDLLRQNQVPLFTVMLDREKVGEFAFESVYNEDFLLWLYFTKNNFSAHLLDRDLGRLRRLPGSVSANKLRAAKEFWIVLRRHEQIPFAQAAVYFVNYAAKSLLKYLIKHRTLHWSEPACPGRILRDSGHSPSRPSGLHSFYRRSRLQVSG